MILELELGAVLYLLNRSSTTEITPPALLCLSYFTGRVSIFILPMPPVQLGLLVYATTPCHEMPFRSSCEWRSGGAVVITSNLLLLFAYLPDSIHQPRYTRETLGEALGDLRMQKS